MLYPESITSNHIKYISLNDEVKFIYPFECVTPIYYPSCECEYAHSICDYHYASVHSKHKFKLVGTDLYMDDLLYKENISDYKIIGIPDKGIIPSDRDVIKVLLLTKCNKILQINANYEIPVTIDQIKDDAKSLVGGFVKSDMN